MLGNKKIYMNLAGNLGASWRDVLSECCKVALPETCTLPVTDLSAVILVYSLQ